MKHINLSAYNDVENLKRFDNKSFKTYVQKKLNECDKHISFLKKKVIDKNWRGKVIEIGSGNSKLLYRLEMEKLLKLGLGYEISASRCRFAEKTKKHLNCQRVNNINKDVLDVSPRKNFDLVIGVDLVYQLITPLYKRAEREILNWANRSLRSGGFLLLELWDFHKTMRLIKLSGKSELCLWEEFPLPDPFRYGLYNIKMDENNDVIYEKCFLKRDSLEESKFKIVLRPYSRIKIVNILKNNAFENIKIFDKWSKSSGKIEGEFIVLAQKKANKNE